MNQKEELTKKFKMVLANEIEISTDEKPIIGTQALCSCIGFILHNQEHKKAIIGHISTDRLMSNYELYKLRLEILSIIEKNELANTTFNLIIIEGAYQSQYQMYFGELEILQNPYKTKYNLLEVLEENMKHIPFIKIGSVQKSNLPENAFETVDEYNNKVYTENATLSRQFAFDASNGTFVTNNVFFGEDYNNINDLNINK